VGVVSGLALLTYYPCRDISVSRFTHHPSPRPSPSPIHPLFKSRCTNIVTKPLLHSHRLCLLLCTQDLLFFTMVYNFKNLPKNIHKLLDPAESPAKAQVINISQKTAVISIFRQWDGSYLRFRAFGFLVVVNFINKLNRV
jgi:hypothetical protein